MNNQKIIQNYLKQGDFKNLFLNYQNNNDLKNDIDKFRAGYYKKEASGCGGCLQCLGATVCIDTICECFGGDFCRWF